MNLLYIDLIKENKKINNVHLNKNLVELEVAATIVKTVDKTEVNLEDSFIYTINVSFSGIEGEITSATIEEFIPDYIDYTLPPKGGLLKNITEQKVTSPENGTKIIFDFESIKDLGVAIALDLSCRFKFKTPSGTTFNNRSILKIDNKQPETAVAERVTLQLTSDFELKKEIIAPSGNKPVSGDILIYKVTLKNKLKNRGEGKGDFGAKISNVIFSDTLQRGLTFDNSITDPIGIDISRVDETYNNRKGTINGNTVTFNLPEYYGTEYIFVYVVRVSNTLRTGQIINNRIQWDANPKPENPTTEITTTITDRNPKVLLIKEGPKHASPGNKISYDIFIRNDGNVELNNVEVIDTIPTEVTINRINTGDLCINLGSYFPLKGNIFISYELDNSGSYLNLGTYSSENGEYVDLSSKVSIGQKITKIKWILPKLPIKFATCTRFRIDGIVNSDITINKTIRNTVNLNHSEITKSAFWDTKIDGLSELRIIKELVSRNIDVFEGDIIRYKLTILADRSQIDDPIITDLLDDKVEYVGNERYRYLNYFDGINTDSTDSNFNAKLASTITIENKSNFSGNRTLIRYKFLDGFKLEQRGEFYVEFDVKVKNGATGEIVNRGVLGNKGDKGVIDDNDLLSGSRKYLDTDDRDGDNVKTEHLLESNEVKNNIIVTKSIASDKKVKGPLDTNFTEHPSKGQTYLGGIIEYRLEIGNVGSDVLNSIELIDILPRRGDTGVIDIIRSRGSEFDVYEVSEVTAEISPQRSSIPVIKIEYSISDDPMRFNNRGQNIGTGVWINNPPMPITSNRAFKITIDNLNLNKSENLIITVKCVTPVGVTTGLVAWNSFALRGTYTKGGQQQSLLPVEPEKVGVEVKAVDNGKVKIGDFVWHDLNGNGIQDSGEPGVNGVTVELYDNNGVNKGSTITTNDFNNNPGFYLFNNLDSGQYQVKFLKPNGFEFTIINEGSDTTKNSKAKSSGNTDRITLNAGQENLNMDAGLVKLGKVGDTVWLDLNEDGVKQSNEPGVGGVTVTLYDCDSQTITSYTQTTDSSGMYLITGVRPGRYYAIFTKPDGYKFVTKKGLVDNTGKSQCFTLQSGKENLEVDAPLINEKNVEVNKEVDLKKAEIGDELTYTITITNKGILPIKNVELMDRLPDGTTFVSNSITVNGTDRRDANLNNNINIGDIQSNAVAIVKFKVRINDTGFIPNKVTNKATIIFDGGREEPPTVVTDVVKSSIGDFVWHDLNGNGLQDRGELGIANVEVNLYLDSGFSQLKRTIQTGTDGKYLFNNLRSGEYYVKFVAPQGYNFTLKNVGGATNSNNSKVNNVGRTDRIVLGKNEDRTDIDAGLLRLATVGDTVWLDANKNGVLDSGESGIENVIVSLYDCSDTTRSRVKYSSTTDNMGKYLIPIVFPGSYYAVFTKPAGYDFVTTGGLVDINGQGKCFTVKSGDSNLDVDAPLIDIKNVTTKKTVDKATAEIGEELIYTIEITNDGVEPIKNVRLIDKIPKGTVFIPNSITVRRRAIVDGDLEAGLNIGKIESKEIVEVKFRVKINDTGFIPNKVKNKARITFTGGESDTPEVETDVFKSSIGDFVWHDLNGDGLQDNGEPGINGVTVKLYKSTDLDNDIITTLTQENGYYLFDNLKSGNYYVRFIAPQGYQFTLKDVGGVNISNNSKVNKNTGRTDEIVLGKNQDRTDIDAGLVKLATVGDTAWLDRNADGIQQTDEPGVGNVLVNLYKCSDNSITQYSANTDNNGKYLITNVLPGRYYAQFTKPAGYNFVTVGNFVDSTGKGNCFSIQSGQIKLDVDVPLIDIKNVEVLKTVNLTTAQIGDELIYTIIVINKGVAPIVNVRMIDPIPNGTIFINGSVEVNNLPRPNDNPQNGILIGTMQPNERSTVIFKVRIGNVLPNPNPIVNKAKIIFTGGDRETPEVETDVVKSSIGDFVWEDLNGDGIQDGNEPGIGNVRVNLYSASNLTTSMRNTRTASDGKYLFDNLRSGTYVVGFVKPDNTEFTVKNSGFDDNINSKADQITGLTDNIELRRNEERLNIDAGIIKLATVGDKAWLDLNEDGIEDPGEPGVGGVRITLYDCDTDTPTQYTAITDGRGMYLIKGVKPGRYYGIFVPRPGYGFVTARGFVDENGKTQCFDIKSGDKKLDVDVPLKKVPCVIETCICGKVLDKCTCLGVECIEVFLMKANVVILKTTTDCLGMYCFKITTPGMYKIVFATMCCGYYITPRVLKINVECGESICDLVTVVCMNKLPERHCKVVCVEQPCCTCEKCSMKKCCENNICCNDNLYNKNN